MNKYQIGQIVYWIKFSYNRPTMVNFEIGSVKQDKLGYKYSSGKNGTNYVGESDLFLSNKEAIEDGCNRLRKLSDE